MSLRVIWQYMDRSVTKKILYGPQKLRSIYYFLGYGPVHILPYDPSFSPYNIFWVTDRSIYCHMTLSAMKYLLYIVNQVLKGSKLRIC